MSVMLHEQTSHDLAVLGGLAGFPGSERYALREVEGSAPLLRLASLDEPDLEFLVAPPGLFFPDYAPEIDDTSAARLGLATPEDALLLVVLTLGGTVAEATANLLAPIVVNVRDGRAAQVVTVDEHSLRAPLRP